MECAIEGIEPIIEIVTEHDSRTYVFPWSHTTPFSYTWGTSSQVLLQEDDIC